MGPSASQPNENRTSDDPVGAFVEHWPEGRDASPGPARPASPAEARSLGGVRLIADDLFGVEGIVTGAGLPDWRRTHRPERANAPLIHQLVDAGAVLVGTAVVDELGLGTLGINAQEGTPLNPVAPDSVPGGSASGSAAAVGAGLADVALVADTTGGARIPASVCGLYGWRATADRLDLAGSVARSAFDAAGLLARDATNLWRAASVLLGGDTAGAALPSSLVLAEDLWDVADDEVLDAMVPSLQRVALRVPIAPLDALVPAAASLARWAEALELLVAHDVWLRHGPWLTSTNPTTSLEVRRRIERGRSCEPAEIESARRDRAQAIDVLAGPLADGAALVLPTTPAIAPLVSDGDADLNDFRDRASMLTCLSGLAGLPQVTVPFVQLAEYPVGLSLIGARGTDASLLAAAAAIARPT